MLSFTDDKRSVLCIKMVKTIKITMVFNESFARVLVYHAISDKSTYIILGWTASNLFYLRETPKHTHIC